MENLFQRNNQTLTFQVFVRDEAQRHHEGQFLQEEEKIPSPSQESVCVCE